MFYTYIIKSKKDGRWYTGSTSNLRKRFKEHNNSKVSSTKGRGPFELIYYEACINEQDARMREKYLKSGFGKRYLRNRLKRFLSPTGFTLIELAVVIIVLSVASVVVIPKLEGLIGGGNLKSSARRLVGMITYVHDQAAATGRKYRLCYDLDTNEYWVASQTEAGEFTELKTALGKRKRLLEDIFFLDVITYPEGKVNQGYTYTEFSPKGFIEKCTIHLQNEAGETCTLLIKSLTGRVKIYDHYVEEE